MREFRRGFHEYGTTAALPEWHLEWSSIMQHHGAPTRLLDFTYSIYVAAYFALEHASADFAAIWSIDAIWAARASKENLRRAGKSTAVAMLPKFGTEQSETAISELIFGDPVRIAWPLNPFRLNERLRIQKGIFVAPGDIALSLWENLAALPGIDEVDRVWKILVPRRMRRDALRQLFHMNISQMSLFPGLDGYARSLGVFHPTIVEPPVWD